MDHTVSRRSLIGALGAGVLLSPAAGAGTFPAASVPADPRELWPWVRAQSAVLGPGHLDVQLADIGCDAYATAFHRWLNASWGIGALYLRRDAQPRVWPAAVLPDAMPGVEGRYGASSRHLGPAIEGVDAALKFQQVVNRERIQARIRDLAAYLRLPRGEHAAAARALAADDGVVLAHVSQETFDALRISVHPGNDAAQLDRCVNALRRRL